MAATKPNPAKDRADERRERALALLAALGMTPLEAHFALEAVLTGGKPRSAPERTDRVEASRHFAPSGRGPSAAMLVFLEMEARRRGVRLPRRRAAAR